jgi:hypothetical protein
MAKLLFMSAPRATGDHIICNGLYRHFASKYDLCVFPVKKPMLLNVTSMLSDLHNIEYMVWPSFITRRSTYVASYLFKKLKFDVAKFAWDGDDFPSKIPMTWDRNIYHQFSLNFNMRWDNFFAPRNIEKENELYELLGCGTGDYAFVHDSPSRNFTIDNSYINPKLIVIKPITKINKFSIFDYRKVLENASEVHCIESSFSALIESINLKKPLYAHRYARPEVIMNPWHAYSYRLDWNIILR